MLDDYGLGHQQSRRFVLLHVVANVGNVPKGRNRTVRRGRGLDPSEKIIKRASLHQNYAGLA